MSRGEVGRGGPFAKTNERLPVPHAAAGPSSACERKEERDTREFEYMALEKTPASQRCRVKKTTVGDSVATSKEDTHWVHGLLAVIFLRNTTKTTPMSFLKPSI